MDAMLADFWSLLLMTQLLNLTVVFLNAKKHFLLHEAVIGDKQDIMWQHDG